MGSNPASPTRLKEDMFETTNEIIKGFKEDWQQAWASSIPPAELQDAIPIRLELAEEYRTLKRDLHPPQPEEGFRGRVDWVLNRYMQHAHTLYHANARRRARFVFRMDGILSFYEARVEELKKQEKQNKLQ